MDGLLTQVSRSYRKPIEEEQLLRPSAPAHSTPERPVVEFKGKISSPEDALAVLKSQPGYEALLSVIAYLRKGIQGKHAFDIRAPSSQAAQLVHVLSTEIIPNYWTVLTEDTESSETSDLENLLTCLRSIPGINALLTYLRALLREAKADPKGLKQSHTAFNIGFTLDALTRLLQPEDATRHVWSPVKALDSPAHARPLRQEFITLFTNGMIISLTAEAEDTLRQAEQARDETWLADSKAYIDWLSRNLVQWIKEGTSDDERKLCADITARTTRLAHSDILVRKLFIDLLVENRKDPEVFGKLLDHLSSLEQRKVLLVILKLLADTYLASVDTSETEDEYPVIWAAVGALKALIGKGEVRKGHLSSWLTGTPGAGIGDGCGIRRAAVAALADDKEAITAVLEKSMSQFGDQLYLRHTPIVQQEAHAQVLLLSAGYVHRLAPIKLNLLTRSSSYLNAISNRIAATQLRARFLGMVVGEALSGLVHGTDKKLDFKMEEMDTEDAKWYKSLVRISDKAGTLDPLRQSGSNAQDTKEAKRTNPKPKPKPPSQPAKTAPKTGFIIEEVEDEEEEEDPDLVPYAKPDSDAEDSDDDPTLINRNKPKAPVYIRDLIAFLRDTEDYDKHKLALTTAPALIRRKANYGTEVSSHAEELATLLVGLQDTFDLENFHELRLQGMIAVVVAQPKKMGPWFAKTFFDGDYSLSQRSSILVVLGLSARELAGFDKSDYADAAAFPSKRLPAKLEKHYGLPSVPGTDGSSASSRLKALPPNAVDNIAQSLSQAFLAPMAAEAADAVTGPDALKISTFTSRLEARSGEGKITKDRREKKAGVRAIPNTTASLISGSFFFPLTSRFQAALHHTAGRRGPSGGVLFQPELLALYLRTLGLLLHAAGPSTLALPQMTSELWDLVLGARGPALASSAASGGAGLGIGVGAGASGVHSAPATALDMGVARGLLFALVALLDVNENDMCGLCQRHGREVVETMEWVGAVFEGTRGGDDDEGGGLGAGEENEVKMLAAGVLVRLRGAVDKYQALLMGDLIGFT